MLFSPPKPTQSSPDPEKAGKSRASTFNSEHSEAEQEWEMVRIPDTPGTTGGLKSPMTPRTKAFNDLDGGAAFASTSTYTGPEFAPPPKAGGKNLAPWGKKKAEKMPWSRD
jgi:hypothetical protein